MRSSSIHKDKSKLKLYISIFIVTAFWFVIMPLMGDDMTFSYLTNGMNFRDICLYSYNYGNGRFLGNTLILLLLKNVLIRSVAKAAVLSAVIFLTAEICEVKTLTGHILTAILILFPFGSYMGELYTWSAGFANYVIPVFLTLLIVYLIKLGDRSGKKIIPLCAAVLILGTASQLFNENTTLFSIVLSAFILFANRKNGRKGLPVKLTYYISSLIGGVIMYLIPVFSQTSEKMNSYRAVSFDYPEEILKTALGNFTYILYSISQLSVIWVVLSVSLIIICKNSPKLSATKKRSRNFVFGTLVSYPVFTFASLVLYNYSVDATEFQSFVISVFAVIYLVTVFAVICKWIPDDKRKTAVTLFILIAVSVAPLLAVSPIGIRTIYSGYMLTVILSLYLAKNAAELLHPVRLEAFTRKASCVVLCSVMCVVTIIYSECTYSSYVRDEYIRSEIDAGATEIHIPPVMHRNMIYGANKIYKTEGLPSLYYRDEPGDVTFILESNFGDWYNEYYDTKEEQQDAEQAVQGN